MCTEDGHSGQAQLVVSNPPSLLHMVMTAIEQLILGYTMDNRLCASGTHSVPFLTCLCCIKQFLTGIVTGCVVNPPCVQDAGGRVAAIVNTSDFGGVPVCNHDGHAASQLERMLAVL
jgi:hypothetical protein